MSNYAYMKRWHHERAHGLLRTTDPARVIEHIEVLLDAGWSLRSIADAAQCTPSTVCRLRRHGQSRIRRDIATRLLTVDPDSILARSNRAGFVLKIGAVRRIQALLAVGHRHSDITVAMLAANSALGTRSQMVLHQRGVWIAASTRDAVCAAYEQLAMLPGPSAKTRRLAAKYGYAPPLAWDDDTIDDPAAQPLLDLEPADELDEIAVIRIMAGTLRLPKNSRAPELTEAVRRMAMRYSDRQIGEQLGMTATAVCAVRIRKNIPAAMPSGRRTA